jgi:hypothetical protein
VKIAIEPDQIPPMVYTMMKKTDTDATKYSFYIAFLLLYSKANFLALKLIGVLTGKGVPCASGISYLSGSSF